MALNQQDFDERVARIERGEGTDDDMRLVDLAKSEGMKPSEKRDDVKRDDAGQTERGDETEAATTRATARGRTASATTRRPANQ